MSKMNKKFGFTLAEILITLTIIGTIAALTIPTLKKDADTRAYILGCQKAYNTLSGATAQLKAEKGTIRFWPEWSSWSDLEKLYQKKMNLTNNGLTSKYKIKAYDDVTAESATADGMLWYTTGSEENCSSEFFGVKDACIGWVVDINGEQGPNRNGADTFYFVVTMDGVVPSGMGKDQEITCSATSFDETCTAYVLRTGKMDYLD